LIHLTIFKEKVTAWQSWELIMALRGLNSFNFGKPN